MDSPTTKLKKSTVAAVIALGFLGSLFCLSLATPDLYYDIVYAGILISAAMTIYYWRKERKRDAKTSPIGMWIILVVFLLFILLCLILPAL
jgi:4-hydroxybenzoate polyprenyltransferase